MWRTRGKPYHPMIQGKIARYHRSRKNQVLREHCYPPGDLEAQLADFIDDYKHRRCHEGLDNLALGNVCVGRAQNKLDRRARTKRKKIALRRHLPQPAAA